jgi:hypothetical protein
MDSPLPRILDMYQDRDTPRRIYQPDELANKPPVQATFKSNCEAANHEHCPIRREL